MPLFVICGVSGSGKSTIGRLLAQDLNYPFIEGDDFHPASNIKKMSAGKPLTDEDRVDWLIAISEEVNSFDEQPIILACSALTPFVQNNLQTKCKPPIYWIKLDVSPKEVTRRMKQREHFMPPSLAQSQFEAWTPPSCGHEVNANDKLPNILKNLREFVENL